MTGASEPEELHVLCLNAGSSSWKAALWHLGANESETVIGTAAVEGLGTAKARVCVRDAKGRVLFERSGAANEIADHAAASHVLFDAFEAQRWPAPDAIGHRLVHGGPNHAAPERVTPTLSNALRELIAFAPLHLPSELAAIEALQRRYPQLPQVVCFDTALHRGLPDVAQRLPLPDALAAAGIRRYGFHGLSYEYVVSALGDGARGRLIIAHLGNGASLCALRDGVSIDTSMGFTPSGGIMMGTRTGDLDPGVLLHLQRELGYDTEKLAHLIDHEAGLLGVSGHSADMQALLASRADHPADALAIALFCYQIKKQIGAYSAVLGGLDTLVFTGGIGEHASAVREAVCDGLAYLGIELAAEPNAADAAIISKPGSRCVVRVVSTDEDRMIARHTAHVLRSQPS